MKTYLLVAVLVLVAIAGGVYFYTFNFHQGGTVQTGTTTSTTGTSPADAHADLIRVASPLANAIVTSPITIAGVARGTWYFEASFPVVLVDWDGKIIAQGVATAQSDWTTTDFVPFTATLSFNTADISGHYSNKGTLILKKDNPSGLPAHDDALEIPVYVK